MIHAWEPKVELFPDNIDKVLLLATLIEKSNIESLVLPVSLGFLINEFLIH